jgi:peptide subunit release factor 1 (eRF1)
MGRPTTGSTYAVTTMPETSLRRTLEGGARGAFDADGQDLTALLRRLADVEPVATGVITAYLDTRPEAVPEAPGRRTSLTVLRDRLRWIDRTIDAHGPARDAFDADARRITDTIEHELDPATEGLAMFAASTIGLWEQVEVARPFPTSIVTRPWPHVLPLARLVGDAIPALVAVVDTNTLRLIAIGPAGNAELDGLDDDPASYRKPSQGGWSESQHQDHVDEHRAKFIRIAAAAVDDALGEGQARRLVIAGDELAAGPLRDALPQRARERLIATARIDMRASRDDIVAEVRPILDDRARETAAEAADRAIAGAASDGLGVAGHKATQRALEAGQVDILVLDGGDQLDADAADELARLGIRTAATVRMVDDHGGLADHDGVAAILRYRVD